MDTNLLELYNNLELKDILNTNKEIEVEQKKFFQTNVGQIVNEGINLGLKAILPDWIEEDVIEVKNTLVNDGFKEALDKAIDKTVELGKEITGIFTGDVKDVKKIREIFEQGKIINNISKTLDWAIDKAEDGELISPALANTIKNGKNIILNIVDDRINVECNNQEQGIKNIDVNIEKWYESYKNKDFNTMQNCYEKIEENLENIIDIENTITKARQVENVHNLIKNNGKNFNLTEDELEIANKLTV